MSLVSCKWVAVPLEKCRLLATDLSHFRVYKDDFVFELYCRIQFQGKSYLCFPRFCLAKLMGTGRIPTPEFMELNCNSEVKISQCHLKLEPFQEHVVNTIMTKFETSRATQSASVMLQLDTGRGKTYVVAGLFDRLKQRMLYIVPTRILQEQTLAALRAAFPEASIIAATGIVSITADITIMVIDSVMMNKMTAFKDVGFVVYDEVHMYTSETRRDVFRLTKTNYCLGMSADILDFANIDINVGKQWIYYWHLGNAIYEDDLDLSLHGFIMPKFNVNLHILEYENHANVIKVGSKINYMLTMSESLAANKHRNEFIADCLKKLITSGRKIIVFTHSKDQVHTLYELVTGKTSRLTSGVSMKEVGEAYHEDTNLVISTFMFGATGISIVDATVLFFAMPPFAYHFKQSTGRILRPNMQKPEMNNLSREIYVVRDSFYFAKGHQDRLIGYCRRRFGL